MLPGHRNMIIAIIPTVYVALGQLIMTSLTKQFIAPQILPLVNLEKLGTYVYISQTP